MTEVSPAPSRSDALLEGLQSIALGVWLGGLATLGAIVAPTVFRTVGSPAAADAMTLVFRRFDRLALVAGAVAVAVEVSRIARRRLRVDAATVCLTVALGLAGVTAAVLSPGIAELHRSGAVRGQGAGGEALQRLHVWAERAGKVEIFALAAFFVLRRLNRRGPSSV